VRGAVWVRTRIRPIDLAETTTARPGSQGRFPRPANDHHIGVSDNRLVDIGTGGTRMTAEQVRSRLDSVDAETTAVVKRLLDLAPRGLAAGYDHGTGEFAQTVRGVADPTGVSVRPEGANLRYAAMAALGLSRLPVEEQRSVLSGRTAADLAAGTARRAIDDPDPGGVALAAWAEAETCGNVAKGLFDRLDTLLGSGGALATVDASWMATAAVAAGGRGHAGSVLDRSIGLLLRHQAAEGIFPHGLPATSQPRWRSHVGSFADQVYPIQALARASAATGNDDWLAAANRTAAQICALQGPHGQWWWHYDARTGGVVEPFPVYSVHQHAMAPMVLFDLAEAGGEDHREQISLGVRWLETHPEVVEELIADRWGLVWRKVGRREPPKAARALHAAATAARPGARLRGLDRLLPPCVVDHECRPYELGWLLYAWLAGGVTDD
jgi:hypothetical protein